MGTAMDIQVTSPHTPELRRELSGFLTSAAKWEEALQGLQDASCATQHLRVFHNEAAHTLAVAQALSRNSSLQRLDIAKLDAEGAAAVGATLASHPSLQHLSIEGFESAAAASALSEGLSASRGLTALHLSSSGTAGAPLAAVAVGPHRHLKELCLCNSSFSPPAAATLAAALGADSSLQHLDLSQCRFEAGALESVATSAAAHPALVQLDLRSCSLRPEAGLPLGHLLQGSRSLRRLDLSHNPHLGDQAAVLLAAALVAPCGLTHLALEGCNVGPAGAAALAEGLRANSALESLQLQNNQVEHSGAAALAAAVACHSTLQELNLMNNGIKGGAGLSAFVADTSPLVTLDLSENLLGCEAAEELAAALRSNERLLVLRLRQCGVGDAGAKALAACLQHNWALGTLTLDHNRIGNKGAEALLEGVRQHPCLTTWKMDSNRLTDKLLKKTVVDYCAAVSLRTRPTSPRRPKAQKPLPESSPRSCSARAPPHYAASPFFISGPPPTARPPLPAADPNNLHFASSLENVNSLNLWGAASPTKPPALSPVVAPSGSLGLLPSINFLGIPLQQAPSTSPPTTPTQFSIVPGAPSITFQPFGTALGDASPTFGNSPIKSPRAPATNGQPLQTIVEGGGAVASANPAPPASATQGKRGSPGGPASGGALRQRAMMQSFMQHNEASKMDVGGDAAAGGAAGVSKEPVKEGSLQGWPHEGEASIGNGQAASNGQGVPAAGGQVLEKVASFSFQGPRAVARQDSTPRVAKVVHIDPRLFDDF